MAAHHNDYRSYLRNTDLESGQHRFHPAAAQSSDSTYRPLLFGTLAVMGLLQVASSVAILLHLTGYLQEVDLTSAPHRPIEEVQTEPVLDALKGTRRNRHCKNPKEGLPSAHLPIRPHLEYTKKGETKPIIIDWDEVHGYCNRMGYQKGKLLVLESGFYYVYAKTCFRYAIFRPENNSQVGAPLPDVSNAQLIQYIYHESFKQNGKASQLTKTGSTVHWEKTNYNMHCAQQGRGMRLEDGDALYVEVSNAWMLDPDTLGTYFGAVKLGN